MTLHINGLTKDYGTVRVLESIELEVADGEFCVLLGPSGCGKSTLLRMIAGLEPISGGTLKMDDTVVNDVHPRDRDIAMVFQNYALYPQMSVRQNIAYPLKFRRKSQTDSEVKVTEVAALLELTELLDRKPADLSGGQRQRVAMGRALVRDPKLFLLDEPLSNLDARLRSQMRVDIREIQQRLGVTTIYVTHDQVEAMTMADKIVVMHGGDIQQIGAPDDIYKKPANRFVAEFIGSPPMNFLDDPVLTAAHEAAFGSTNPHVDLAIRPEHILQTKPEEEVWEAPVHVGMVEVLGSDSLLHLTLAETPNEQHLVAKWPENHRALSRTDITVYMPKSAFLLFDHETGERVEPNVNSKGEIT